VPRTNTPNTSLRCRKSFVTTKVNSHQPTMTSPSFSTPMPDNGLRITSRSQSRLLQNLRKLSVSFQPNPDREDLKLRRRKVSVWGYRMAIVAIFDACVSQLEFMVGLLSILSSFHSTGNPSLFQKTTCTLSLPPTIPFNTLDRITKNHFKEEL